MTSDISGEYRLTFNVHFRLREERPTLAIIFEPEDSLWLTVVQAYADRYPQTPLVPNQNPPGILVSPTVTQAPEDYTRPDEEFEKHREKAYQIILAIQAEIGYQYALRSLSLHREEIEEAIYQEADSLDDNLERILNIALDPRQKTIRGIALAYDTFRERVEAEGYLIVFQPAGDFPGEEVRVWPRPVLPPPAESE